MDKEYFLELGVDAVVYVYFTTEKGEIKDFVVKLLCESEGEWHEVLRYDSGHDCPHKDVLDIEGNVIRKIWYDYLDNSQALTMAITEIKESYEFYKERYIKWLKGN
jgi:hypothetical protein